MTKEQSKTIAIKTIAGIRYVNWYSFPKKLKGNIYERPEWTKYLPGVK